MTDQMTRLDWLLLLFFTAGFGVSAWMLWGGLRIAIRSVNR